MKLRQEHIAEEWDEGHPKDGGDGYWIFLKSGWKWDGDPMVGLGGDMKRTLALLVVLVLTIPVFASEIVPPDMRIPQLVQEARKFGYVTELWGVDYRTILKSDKTMTKDRVLELFRSIAPEKIKLAKHEHLATIITMLEPKQIVFTFEARDSKRTKGPPTSYFLIKIEKEESNQKVDPIN